MTFEQNNMMLLLMLISAI